MTLRVERTQKHYAPIFYRRRMENVPGGYSAEGAVQQAVLDAASLIVGEEAMVVTTENEEMRN